MQNIDNKNVIELPRGGYILKTSVGNIQFGAPPETIKDTISTPDSVPRLFVLPTELFHWQKGINVADMEFPIYFNFFLKKQKIVIFCREDQAKRMIIALREAVFGPKRLDLSKDVYHGAETDIYVPDITNELAFFRGSLELTDLFNLKLFRNNEASYGNVTIRIDESSNFVVTDNDTPLATIPGTVNYQAKYEIGERLPEPFIPPRFGVTCLGPSHGFDPKDNTSGFIIWLNGNGIMIDPPVNSTEWLVRSNVNPKFIDSIILTHCHADHDAGTFQKILEEARVTIYTTRTVMESFMHKYAAFSGEGRNFLRRLFTYRPVYMGRPFYLHGGEFNIFYSVHSIPTMGFRLVFQGKTFVYSSDHQGDPAVQKTMLEQNIITNERYEQLRNFPWNSDVIYHEAGIAPLHTPVAYLNSLPESIQRKTVVYHIASKDFPADHETQLTHATFGIENTLYFDTTVTAHEEAYKVLDILKHLDFFPTLSPGKVQEFLHITNKKVFKREEKIIQEGTPGDTFYIIHTGNARVDVDDLVRSKRLGAYEYFGEVALLAGTTRTADIVAETDTVVYCIGKNHFVNFIAGTEFERVLRRLIKNRSQATWNILVSSPFFQILTDYQRMWLESALVLQERPNSGIVIEEHNPLPGIYIIYEGQVTKSRGAKIIRHLTRGDVIGSLNKFQRGGKADFTFSHDTSVKLFFIDRTDILNFIQYNPGAVVRMSHLDVGEHDLRIAQQSD